ncbi:hypothetical protein JCM9957A_19670 [Kineosporia succinea]
MVAVDQGDLVELVGQDAGREQSRDAATQHHGPSRRALAHVSLPALGGSVADSVTPRRFSAPSEHNRRALTARSSVVNRREKAEVADGSVVLIQPPVTVG